MPAVRFSFYCCCVGNVVCGGFVVVCSLYLVRRFGFWGCVSAAAFRLRFLVCRSSGPRVCISMAVVGRVALRFCWWAFVRARNTMRYRRGPVHTRALRVSRAETRLTVYRAQQVLHEIWGISGQSESTLGQNYLYDLVTFLGITRAAPIRFG